MMNPAAAALLLALTALLPAAQSQPAPKDEDPSSPQLRIEWAEFKKLYDAGKIEVVDVRDGAAFELGHIPGARWIPLEDVEKRAAELRKLQKPIVLYCS
jgi:3-mercaptopyruvate sulfurtransferase SseA